MLKSTRFIPVILLSLACSSEPPASGDPEDSGNNNNNNGTGGSVNKGGGASTSGGTSAKSSGGSGGTDNSSGSGGGGQAGDVGDPTNVKWPSAACEAKADELLAKMTVQEKAAQMVMAMNPPLAEAKSRAPGSVFSGGVQGPPGGNSPATWASFVDTYLTAGKESKHGIPFLYGIDAVHGHNKATGTVIFPHNAGLGSTQSPELVEEIGRITAIEVAATGINWTFAPVLSVSYDDRWGRVYESFSEDAELAAELGAAATMGLQGRGGLGRGKPGIVACAKHFAADGQATAGTSAKGGVLDRGDVRINEASMRKLGVDPYLPAIRAGLGSIMVSDARWNGANMTSHKKLITDILKNEIGFKGFVATDWEAANQAGGVIATVNAGVDMLMQPNDWAKVSDAIAGAAGKEIPTERIDDAARRILTVKCEAGLFDWKRDPELLKKVGSPEHREVGRRAVRESLVLLKHENSALPLQKGQKLWVGGSGANDLDRQCGGWSVSWQNGGRLTKGTTVRAALEKHSTIVSNMAEADAGVVVLSEKPYAEFLGDSSTIDTIAPADFDLLKQLKDQGKKVVAIVISGRPVLITDHLDNADAWLAAWLPGTEGDGIADVLFGDHKPTGKLSHSWPRSMAQVAINFEDEGYDPLFRLGHGLSW